MEHEVRQATERYVAQMERALPQLKSPAAKEFLLRQTAAACRARSVSLLRAMRVLGDKGFNDHLQLLARTGFETAMNGAYILAGGRDHYLRLVQEYHDGVRKMNNANEDLGLDPVVVGLVESDLKSSDGEKVTAPSLKERVEFVTKHAGLPKEKQKSPYDVFYRGTSTTGVHGLGSVLLYMDISDEGSLVVIPRSGAPSGADTVICVTALYVGYLASQLFEEFEISTGDLDAACEAVVAARRRSSQ